jgi:hypothetical protein
MTKLNVEGEVKKHKARLVAQGCWTHLPHLEGGVNECGVLFPKTSLLHKKLIN